MEPYQPIQTPNSFTFSFYRKKLANKLRHWLSIFKLKKAIQGWKEQDFLKEVEQKYIEMNSNFAQQKLENVRNLVTNGMYLKLGSIRF
jgi:hypothetical protein